MADKVYVVGAYVSNEDPLLRVRAFIPLATEFQSLDEAVTAAQKDFRQNDPDTDVTFVVYKSPAGDAIIEVSRGGPFKNAGFYKVAQLEAAESDAG